MAETKADGPTSQETREKGELDSSAVGPWVLVARKRKQGRQTVKENKTEATSGLQSPIKPTRPFSPPSRSLFSDIDPKAEATRNSDMSGSSTICADRNKSEPTGTRPKPSHVTSKGMKPIAILKGKKSIVHSGQGVIRQKSLPEWKIIKTMESETTR